MIGAVVVAIIGAVQSLRLASHERPIKKKEAEAVSASSLGGVDGVYGELFDNLQTELGRMSDRVDALSQRVATLETENEQERNRNRILTWYIDDIHLRWPIHRARDTPPPRPDTI